MRVYRAVFSRQALDFVATSDDDVFAEIDGWVNRIERAPSTSGDYHEHDIDQRELQIVVLHRVAVAYWPDHAAQELRVVRIEANSGN